MRRLLLFSLVCLQLSVWAVEPNTEIKVTAVGDIMLGTAYPDGSLLPRYNSFNLFKPLLPYLQNSDVCFGNLEGTITSDFSQVKKCMTDGRCYFFAMPPSDATSLKKAGFNLISIANNHQNDFGAIGRKHTRSNLKKQGIRFAGLLECPIDTFVKGGVRYGFCAFAPNALTVSVKDIKKAVGIVKYLNSVSDVVIISFHAGLEGVDGQNVTRKTEYYISEDRGNVYNFAHAMIDAGADILLGHGPHVTRAVELYKNRFISYSMGNFCTYSCVSVQGLCGIAPLFQIYTTNKGEFLRAQIVPTYQAKFQPPRVDAKKRAIAVIQKLTGIDFPEMKSVIRISSDGWIEPVNPTATQRAANAQFKKQADDPNT